MDHWHGQTRDAKQGEPRQTPPHRQLYLTSTHVCVVCSLRCVWMQAHLCHEYYGVTLVQLQSVCSRLDGDVPAWPTWMDGRRMHEWRVCDLPAFTQLSACLSDRMRVCGIDVLVFCNRVGKGWGDRMCRQVYSCLPCGRASVMDLVYSCRWPD